MSKASRERERIRNEKYKTIDCRLAEILKKHGEDVCGNVTYEDAKKQASRKWKNVVKFNSLNTTIEKFTNFRGESIEVEHWLVFIFDMFFEDDMFGSKEEDFWIKDFIKAAICCEYRDAYNVMFD